MFNIYILYIFAFKFIVKLTSFNASQGKVLSRGWRVSAIFLCIDRVRTLRIQLTLIKAINEIDHWFEMFYIRFLFFPLFFPFFHLPWKRRWRREGEFRSRNTRSNGAREKWVFNFNDINEEEWRGKREGGMEGKWKNNKE